MSSIRIGSAERTLQSADPQWINQQVQGLRRDGNPICIVINIREGDLNLSLQTSACGGAGRGRPPNRQAQVILDLWTKHHLNEASFGEGNVVAFVQQLRGFL